MTLQELTKQFLDHQHNSVDGTLPIQKSSFASWALVGTSAATAGNYGIFFVATKPCSVKAISEVHTVAGTNASAVTLQVERLQGTEALDAGDLLLATAFNLKGTANTVQRGVLTSVNKTFLSLQVGDRLALRDSGTLTDVAGVCVTVELQYA